MTRRIPLILFIAVSLSAVASPGCNETSWVVQAGNFGPGSVTVSGRLDDPHGLRTEDAVVAMYRRRENGASGIHLEIAKDGSFASPLVPSGFYSFEVVRTPYSATHPATAIGVGWVDVDAADVTGLVLSVRRDTELVGSYRIAGDRANPPWPKSVHVQAPLVVGGTEIWWGAQVTHGAEGGRFILRNAYGPRVLRVSDTPASGYAAARVQVLLDGRDITNVPTDFSEHESSKLEVVLNVHARLPSPSS